MKAEEKRLLQFLEGSDKNFIIPVYQRNYDWKKEQCKQLFDDIIEIAKSNFRTHFLWTIVAYNDDWYWKELLIIDWQQRLTTISILLLAIYKVLESNELKFEYINKEKIFDEFLINKYSKDQTKKIRLKPIKDDRNAFEGIFAWDKIENSNITINYEYFADRIKRQEISIDDLYKAIENLIIVEILLRKWEDDPQLIFESLNSTGLDLSEADKVRNFILMKQTTEKQEELYNNYWSKIEKNTSYKVSDFIRDYLTLKERKIPNLSKVYITFKEYALKNNFIEIEDILKDLLKYTSYYSKIIHSKDEDKEISKILKNLNNLEVIVMYPFLLELYDDKESGIIDNFEFLEILKLLESFVFRRFICDVPTNALNKIFMLLGKEIKNFPDYKKNYIEIFKYILLSKTWTQRFPNDEEFEEYLLKKDIYNTQSKNKLHLLERLENNNNKESYVSNLIEDWTLSIEHIMPQTLTPEWEKELWEKYNEIQIKYLHTLWNITLTWYNSKYSNKSFREKKEIENWFNESPLFLNQYLKSCEKWTEKEILERYKILKAKSLKIWNFPETNYEIQKDVSKLFTLEDSEQNSFIWMKIEWFSFKWKDYKVNTWAEMYEIIIKILYDFDPYSIKSFITDEKLSYNFLDNDKWNTCRKIDDNIYVDVWTNTDRKMNYLIIIFNKLWIDLNDLEFYIK